MDDNIKIKGKLSIEAKQKIAGALFLAPWVAGFVLFWAYPIFKSAQMSMQDITIRGEDLETSFAGLSNFQTLLTTDIYFIDAFLAFVMQTAMMVPVIVLFALIIAILLNQKFPGKTLFRVLFFLPVVLTTGDLLILLMDQGQGAMDFLANPSLEEAILLRFGANMGQAIYRVLTSFIIILWYSGVQILILLAGMQSISVNIYESALIDGANRWEMLWKITLPSISPFIFICIVFSVIDQATMPLNPLLDIMPVALAGSRVGPGMGSGMGYAAAMGWMQFIYTLFFIGIAFVFFRKSLTQKG